MNAWYCLFFKWSSSICGAIRHVLSGVISNMASLASVMIHALYWGLVHVENYILTKTIMCNRTESNYVAY